MQTAQSPPVVTWFKVYAAIMSFIYLLIIGLGFFFILMPDMADDEGEQWFVAIILFAVGFPLMALFAAGIFLSPKPWVWIYDLVLICLGFTSCLTLPFCIALLVFWLKPETKAYFGRV
jgi:hypothetical protein